LKVSLKLDADDQEKMAQEEREKLASAAKQAQTPKWDKSPNEVAIEVIGRFARRITAADREDLIQKITEAIEAERKVTAHYMTQMGRWWARLNEVDTK